MRNVLILLILTIILSGCVSTKTVDIQTTAVPRAPLVLPKIDVVTQHVLQWYAVNEDNSLDQLRLLVKLNETPAFMCISDEGYESISLNFAQSRQIITQQQAIIGAYAQYYTDQSTKLDDFDEAATDAEEARRAEREAEKSKGLFRWFKR